MVLKSILFVSHDGNRAGAQLFLLNVVKYLKSTGKFKISVLFLENGTLIPEFRKMAKVFLFPEKKQQALAYLPAKLRLIFIEKKYSSELNEVKLGILNESIELIYANTVAISPVFDFLISFQKPIISHFHELPFSINLYSTPENLTKMLANSSYLIGCSNAVSANLISNYAVEEAKLMTIHSFIDTDAIIKKIAKTKINEIKIKFQIPQNKKIVLSCGNAEHRKGIDLFIELAAKFKKYSPLCQDTIFIWVGIQKSGELYEKCLELIDINEVEETVILIEQTPFAQELIFLADVFALTSREDPFPLVMLEAAACKKPIVGFKESGGCAEFVETDAGISVSNFNVQKMAEEIDFLLKNNEISKQMGAVAFHKCTNVFNYKTSMSKIENVINHAIKITHSTQL